MLNWLLGKVQEIREEAEAEVLTQQAFAQPHGIWDKHTRAIVEGEDCGNWDAAVERCEVLNKEAGFPRGLARYVPIPKQ